MTDFWLDFPGIPEDLSHVQKAVQEALGYDHALIQNALGDLFEGDGKLLRPGLLLIASRFGKRDEKKTIALAAALEMLHVATLIHDDIVDDSPLRRGLPAVHSRYGKKDAVLMGDFLLSRCFILTASYTSPANATLLAKAISVICAMEIEQDLDRFTASPSIRRYLRKIMGKTAVLFSLACHAGSSEAKVPLRTSERLRRAGYDLGMAFQIIDDILDYESTESLVRKPVGNDLKAGLATLPLLCALRNDDGKLAEMVNPTNFRHADVPILINTVIERNGIQDARTYAHRYTNRALAEIAALPPGTPRELMHLLATRLLDRTY